MLRLRIVPERPFGSRGQLLPVSIGVRQTSARLVSLLRWRKQQKKTRNPASVEMKAPVRDRHDRATLAIAILGIIVAVCAFAVTCYQVWTIKDNAKRQLRAYLYVTPTIRNFAVNSKPEVSIVLMNGGQTPAYNFNATMHMQIRPFPQSEPMITLATEPTPPSPTRDGIGAFVYREHEITLNLPPHPAITEEQYKAVIEGTSTRLYVWGRIVYLDAFKEIHHVNFCFTIDGEALRTKRAHFCVDYNDAD